MLICVSYYYTVLPAQLKGIKGSVLVQQSKALEDCLQIEQSLVEAQENGVTTLLCIANHGYKLELR